MRTASTRYTATQLIKDVMRFLRQATCQHPHRDPYEPADGTAAIEWRCVACDKLVERERR